MLPPSGWDVEEESPQVNNGGDQAMEIGLSGKVVFPKPPTQMTKHLRPLYVKAKTNGIPVTKVLIDNGATTNAIPVRMLRRLAKFEEDLLPTEVVLTSFIGGATMVKGVIPLDL